jgi:hypothetical protein
MVGFWEFGKNVELVVMIGMFSGLMIWTWASRRGVFIVFGRACEKAWRVLAVPVGFFEIVEVSKAEGGM